MALLTNNTVTPSSSISASNPRLAGLSGQISVNPSGNIASASGQASAAALGQTTPITGLVSPSHPTVGSLPSSAPLASHTVTTNPDNSVTSKVTYAPTSTDSSSQTSPSTPQTQYNSQGQSIGTQHPGMVGFNPQTPQNVQAPSTSGYDGTPGFLPAQQFSTPGNPYTEALGNAAIGGSQNATAATKGLLNAPNQNALLSQEAQNIGGIYGANISKISNYGNALADSYTNGAGLAPVSQGLAGQAQQTTAAEVAGQQAAENAALAPINQELTAQSQAQSGLASAGGIANTQQANTQSGLTSAGTLAQPQTTSPGQAVFNPATGQYTSASSGGGNPSTAPSGIDQGAWSTYANDLATGNVAAIPTSITGNANLFGQLQQAATAQNPNFNYNTAVGQGTGQQAVAAAGGTTQAQNIATAGTAVTGANAQGLAQSIQQETALNTAAANATALAGQVSTALTNSGLNMTNSTDANTAINNLQSRLGNAGYTQLNIAVNDARNAYQAILTATGATPTDAGAAANQNINANMSPKQILAAIDQLSQGVNARQQSQHAQTLQYQNQLANSGSTGNTSSGVVQTSYGSINPNL